MAGVKVDHKAGDGLGPVERLRHKRFCGRAAYPQEPDKVGRPAPFRAEGKSRCSYRPVRYPR
jgi:hypothetical protein